MPVSLALLTFIASLLILATSIANLHLNHWREGRSDVDILPEDSGSTPEFIGGSHAIDGFWTGAFHLKIVNTGVKGAYVRSISHELVGLKKEGQEIKPTNATIEVNDTRSGIGGAEIEPRSSSRYRVRVKIIPEDDIGPLVAHDSAIIQHTLEIEDNKGSYEASHTTEMKLVGPDGALENWREYQKEAEQLTD